MSTVDKHTVHVWSTKHPEWPSLKLHSTKALTVSDLKIIHTVLMLVVYGQFWPSDYFHLRLAESEIKGAFIMCMELVLRPLMYIQCLMKLL